MNIVLWVFQLVLAFVFFKAGWGKAVTHTKIGADALHWKPETVRALGIVEILAGIGMLLPVSINILPWMTSVAAIGMVMVMIGAIRAHLAKKEYKTVRVNSAILVIAAVVAIGRFI